MADCLGVVWSAIPLSTEYGLLLAATGMGNEISEVLTSVSRDSEEGRDDVLPLILGPRFEGSCRDWSVLDSLDAAWLSSLSTDWGLGGLAATARMGGGTSGVLTSVSNDSIEGENKLPPILELVFGIGYSD